MESAKQTPSCWLAEPARRLDAQLHRWHCVGYAYQCIFVYLGKKWAPKAHRLPAALASHCPLFCPLYCMKYLMRLGISPFWCKVASGVYTAFNILKLQASRGFFVSSTHWILVLLKQIRGHSGAISDGDCCHGGHCSGFIRPTQQDRWGPTAGFYFWRILVCSLLLSLHFSMNWWCCRYIATVSMLPSIMAEKNSPLYQTVLEILAFTFGVGMMLLVALFE